MKPSADYASALAATQKFHKRNKGFSGRFLLRYLEDVKAICQAHKAKTVLDYGCGRGEQYETPLEPLSSAGKPVYIPDYLDVWDITKYDPGVPEFSAEPQGRYDLVLSTQVLGSIPVSDLTGWVLDRIMSYAVKAVYIGEVLNDAPRKTLHRGLAESGKMPHGWNREQWVEIVGAAAARHSKIGVYLRTKDKRTGAPKGTRHLDTFNIPAD